MTATRQNTEIMCNTKSLIERETEVLSNSLQELVKDMDKPNRERVAKRLKCSERTVYRYLSGEVADNELARKIIAACRENIIDREQKLSNHAA